VVRRDNPRKPLIRVTVTRSEAPLLHHINGEDRVDHLVSVEPNGVEPSHWELRVRVGDPLGELVTEGVPPRDWLLALHQTAPAFVRSHTSR